MANWIWSPYRTGVLKFRPSSESPGRHTQWAPPWACPMSSKSEIEPENTSIKFLSNADGREAIWRITLLRSTLQSPWLWTVGPGNPQSQMTIPVCFPAQWCPEPLSLGVGKFFSAHTALQIGCQWERDFQIESHTSSVSKKDWKSRAFSESSSPNPANAHDFILKP